MKSYEETIQNVVLNLYSIYAMENKEQLKKEGRINSRIKSDVLSRDAQMIMFIYEKNIQDVGDDIANELISIIHKRISINSLNQLKSLQFEVCKLSAESRLMGKEFSKIFIMKDSDWSELRSENFNRLQSQYAKAQRNGMKYDFMFPNYILNKLDSLILTYGISSESIKEGINVLENEKKELMATLLENTLSKKETKNNKSKI